MQRIILFWLICVGALVRLPVLAENATLAEANQKELAGHFKEAAAILTKALQQDSLSVPERKQYEFELDRLERIRLDFRYTREGLFADLQKSVSSLTPEEFDQWIKAGRFDTRQIDGEQRFMGSSVANLFFRYPELQSRRIPRRDTVALQQHHWEVCREIKEAAMLKRKPYVLPKRFEATMAVTADADAAPAGEMVRAWLPFPRAYPFQKNAELVSASPPVNRIDGAESPIRSAYLEQPAVAGQPTSFKIQYDYTAYGVSFDLKPDSVTPCNPDEPALKQYLAEAPHVLFTPKMRALAAQIAGSETNPCLKAKRFYYWIAGNIKYSFAIEYSTVRNLSDYCFTHGYGDCGQEAMLFITLCRLGGIPARWQSGWNTFPGDKDIHDWSEIYLAPYGWVPVDPYMGIYAMRIATGLSDKQREEIRDFYFGGLDQYRMIANSDHCQELTPPKNSFRSDNVDFQRGELECGTNNIYFNRSSYSLNIRELPPGAAVVEPRGGQFIGFHDFSSFEQGEATHPDELVLISPVIHSRIAWKSLVTSWNAHTPEGAYLKMEARGLYRARATKYYQMGSWSDSPAVCLRESTPGQKDADGDVSTDTLVLTEPAEGLQVRVTLGGTNGLKPNLRFLGLALLDGTTNAPELAANRAAWGKLIPVVERSQMGYPDGKSLCSPTSLSMLMSYWSGRLKRPELDHDVPEIVKAIYDYKWEGTGNWSFNVAYAGSWPGMRSYVSRMSGLPELEDWIASGFPVALSVCYDRLRGKGPGPEGHLVVCVGFTKDGDPIINDPGTSKNVRKIFPRKNLVNAWAYSHNTAYIVYPQGAAIPKDRFGHWDSWTAQQELEMAD